MTRQPRAAEQTALAAALAAGQLRVEPDPVPGTPKLAQTRLDDGERSAIALALQRRAVVLVDERCGRAAALEAGLQVIGSLGLLVRARQCGLVPHVRPLAQALLDNGYYVARPLVERTLAVVGE